MSDINILFGKRLRELRLDKGFSQEEFAQACGLHRTYIGQIERAEKNITLRSMEKIADTLGLELKELLDFNPKKRYFRF